VEAAAPVERVEAMTAEALAERPRINALREEVRALEAQASAERGGRFPDLTFVGRYVYARPNAYFFAEQDRFRSTWELGFSARWNVWEGGRVAARTSGALARLDAAQARLVEEREQAAVDVARQQLEVERTGDAVGAAAQNVSAAEETFRVARQQFEEGAALSADVLDAEQALWRARSRRAEALAEHAIARAALLHARGRIQ
jgi:outer membrane protein